MAANQFLSLPGAQNGLSPTSGGGVWAFGSWVVASASVSTDIHILGFTFDWPVTTGGSTDVNFEGLFEIGTGSAGGEVTKLQIPYTIRNDTAVGYYLVNANRFFFPEPYVVPSGTRVAVRVAGTNATITYDAVKIFYMEASSTPTLLPSVFDSATITEGVTILLPTLYPSVFDSATITENVTILLPTLFSSVFDTITVTENVNVLIEVTGTEFVSDSVTLSEQVTVLLSSSSRVKQLMMMGVGV